MVLAAEERFWVKVDKRKASPCWIWTARRTKDGYGYFWSGDYYPHNKQPIFVLAHRWSYEQVHGPIPKGKNVCHSCDNPPCVNPSHLFVASQRENVRDCILKGRHRNGRKMLTPNEEKAILKKFRGRYGEVAELAKEFGVSHKVVTRVTAHRKRYYGRHLS